MVSEVWLSSETWSYLHVGMVGRHEGLVHRRGAAALTAVCIVAFGIDDPLTPLELFKVHPHIHLPAGGAPVLLLLLRVRADWSVLVYPLPPGWSAAAAAVTVEVVVPPGPASSGSGFGSRSRVQTDVFRVLSSVDKRGLPLAAGGLPGEDHHHDPVGSRVVVHLLVFFLLRHLLQLLCTLLLLQPVAQHLCSVEHLPGGRGETDAGTSPKPAQEQPAFWASLTLALAPVGVVDIYPGPRGFWEGGYADAKLCQVNVVAGRHGGQVKVNGPPLAPLLAAWKVMRGDKRGQDLISLEGGGSPLMASAGGPALSEGEKI